MNRAQSPIPDPRIAEAFQSLRVQLDLAAQERPLHSLLVASPLDGGDKTVVAAYLGAVYAWAGRAVLLVSADLHRPALEDLFGVNTVPGLREVAVHELDLPTVLGRTWIPNLGIVPAGAGAAHPADVLASGPVQQVLKEAQAAFDVVIIEAPPVLAGAEAALLVPNCDGVVLVLEAGRTTGAEALAAKTELEKVRNGAAFLGVVVTNARDRRARSRRPRHLVRPARRRPRRGRGSPGLKGQPPQGGRPQSQLGDTWVLTSS